MTINEKSVWLYYRRQQQAAVDNLPNTCSNEGAYGCDVRSKNLTWGHAILHKVVVSIGCVMFSATVFAGASDIKASNNQIGTQVIFTYVDYTETGNGVLGTTTGTIDTERGWVLGSALSISMMKDWWLGNDYIEAEYDNSVGNTQYVGALQDGGEYGSVVQPAGAKQDNYSARYGKGFVVNNEFMLTPYAEFGHRKWYRMVNYGETYTHNYYGIGALAQYSTVRKLVFSVNALWGHTYGSAIVVNGQNGFSGGLGNSSLYKAGLSADYAFMTNIHGYIGVSYMSFKYGISALYPLGGGIYTWEPDSKTNHTTVRLGFGYAF